MLVKSFDIPVQKNEAKQLTYYVFRITVNMGLINSKINENILLNKEFVLMKMVSVSEKCSNNVTNAWRMIC